MSHNKKEPLAMRSSRLFGKDFCGSPKVMQVYYLSLIPSNIITAGRCPVELVSAILSQPIKKTIKQGANFYQTISLKTAVRNKTDLVDTSGVSRSIGIARHLINIVLVQEQIDEQSSTTGSVGI